MLLSAVVIGALLLAGYVRLAPSHTAQWHIALSPRPAVLGAPSDQVIALEGGAYIDIKGGSLAALDAIVMATARTQRLSGSLEEGRITWITRSRVWGFPDYTTAEITPDGLTIYARLRFGRSDLGVNAARLRGWAARLNLS